MFQKAKNIDKAFQQVRAFSLILVAGSLGFAGFVAYQSYQLAAQVQSKIYVLANGKALEAHAEDRRQNLPVEAKDHVRSFHQLFFTLDPDEKVIQGNITRALYLADASAKKVYESLKENNYYAALISGNVSQEIRVDSVVVNVDYDPMYFRCWAEQTITRPSNITTRSLITEGYLRSVSRSDNNPHGFLIEKWNTIENRDLKTTNR